MEFRVYKVAELKKVRPGTVFEHKRLGKGIVKRNGKTGLTYMVFKDKYTSDSWFIDDNFPWDEPMKVIDG